MVEQSASFFSIPGCGLFEEDVFASFEGFESPFEVQAIGEWVVDGV